MKYPKVAIAKQRLSKSGRQCMDAVAASYPGGFSTDSNIVFRWGQQTDFPPGKTIVIFDCGYFRRGLGDKDNRHFRISINEKHPTNLEPESTDRWSELGIELESLFDSRGHIILVGRGGKTRALRDADRNWEANALQKIKARFPDRKVIYRPKNNPNERLAGAITDGESSIRKLCKGASLIYTDKSNVGNEGILYGIPVVSEGGPASDICSSTVDGNIDPLPDELRRDFLNRLSHWQRSENEIKRGKIWPWLMKKIESRCLRGR